MDFSKCDEWSQTWQLFQPRKPRVQKEFWIWFLDNLTKAEGPNLGTNMSWWEVHMEADLEFTFIVHTAKDWGLQKETEMVRVVFKKMNLADV